MNTHYFTRHNRFRQLSGLLIGVFCWLTGFVTPVWAAEPENPVWIKGQVTGTDQKPIAGASVVVKNTWRGVASDVEGRFKIEVVPADTLVVSMLGYETQEIRVGNKTVLTVVMKETQISMDEVVVIGYGEQQRKDVTGTITTVSAEMLNKAPVLSFDQSLQGRAAGVVISSNDGQPGQDMNIVIRGSNSLTQSNSPLFVVDGFPLEDFSASAISPADIVSISILKDASAAAIYGSRGANGVVIIETKKGRIGKAKVNYSSTVGVQKVAKTMDLMNPYDYVSYMIEMFPESSSTYLEKQGMTLEDYRQVAGIDWQERLFHTAMIQNHAVSVSGGTEKTKYFISGSYSGQDGIIRNSGYERYAGRLRLDQALGQKVRLHMNLSYTSEKTHGATASQEASSANSYSSYIMYRVWTYRPVLLDGLTMEDALDDDSSLGLLNPIKSNENENQQTKNNTFQAQAKLTWKITNDLQFHISGGYYDRNRTIKKFNNSFTFSGYPSVNNSKGPNAQFANIQMLQYVNENTLNYTKRFNNRHFLSALAGFTVQRVSSDNYGYTTDHIPYEGLGFSGMDEGIPSGVTAAPSVNKLMSVLARVNYTYRSKYLLTLSFRADGSSKFASGHRWGYFPSAAVAWRMKNENFLRPVKWIEESKLRLSWGQTGNNRVGSYASYGGIGLTDYYSFDQGTPAPGAGILTLNNPYLTWETTEQADIGYDLSLFRKRLNLTLDVYRKTTKDLLLNTKMPFSSGVGYAYRNVGKIRNEGLEISLNTVNIRNKSFSWTSDFNISFNRSKVLRLADGQDYLLSSVNFTGVFNNTALYITQVGKPATAFYGVIHDGVYQYEDFNPQTDGSWVLKPSVPTNGNARGSIQPGDIKYVDQNADGVINDDDKIAMGRALPVHTGGFNNDFTWKNWSLNVFFQWSYGNKIMNANRIMLEGNAIGVNINQFASYTNRWTPEHPVAHNFRAGGQGPQGVYSSRTLEDGSFLRLKTVQLAYTLPEHWVRAIKFDQIRVFVAGQNLFTWSGYSGLDPEVSTKNTPLTPGFDYSAYARNRIFTAGLQFNF